MSSHARAPLRVLPLVAAAILSLSACGSSTPLANVQPTPGVDDPKTPVMRCAPPLVDAAAQLVQADCVAPALGHAS